MSSLSLSLSLSLKEHESEGGRTPLMKAVRAGHLETAQYLISKGNTHTLHCTVQYILILSISGLPCVHCKDTCTCSIAYHLLKYMYMYLN